MEENLQPRYENNFIFSKTIRAGKRIYYFDVKKTQTTDSLYITITESKKNTTDDEQKPQVSFTKQRLLLYKEDFGNFVEALNECVDFIDRSDNEEVGSGEEQDFIAK